MTVAWPSVPRIGWVLAGAALGLAAHAVFMAAGYGYDRGYALLALAAAALGVPVALWAGWAPNRSARASLVTGAVALLSLPGWSGWPIVGGSIAVALAGAEVRSSKAAIVGIALGGTALVVGSVAALTG